MMVQGNFISKFFIPRYSELMMYLMSLAFFILLVTDAELRSIFYFSVSGPHALIGGIFAAGMVLSLYHIFTQRKKSGSEKMVMLLFAVGVSSITGIVAGFYVLKNSQGLLILFPIWNIINGVLLVFMYIGGMIKQGNIDDHNPSNLQVVIGSIIVFGAIVICEYFCQMYWAVTYSICVFYSTNISGIVQSLFSK